MTENLLRGGDYVPDGFGGFVRLHDSEALLACALFKLTCRRGALPFLPELGSELWRLGQMSPAVRQAAAEQAVVQALEEEDLTVDAVTLTKLGDGVLGVTVELTWNGQTLTAALEVR